MMGEKKDGLGDGKKEVLDYLRNQQKAAEIEAKINGVNIWVLFGAIAVVGWQLLSLSRDGLWGNYELIARTMLLAVLVNGLFGLIGRSGDEREDLRFSPGGHGLTDLPYWVLIRGILMILPGVAMFLISAKAFGVFVAGLFGVAYIVVALKSIYLTLFPTSKKGDRLPNSEFSSTRRTSAAITLFFVVISVIAILEQMLYFQRVYSGLLIEDVKSVILISVFYVLLLIIIDRKFRNDGIGWTYDLETDVLLGTISPDVAMRRIESRRLGVRLQDVVEGFFDYLDFAFVDVESKLIVCREKFHEASQVPDQYPSERAARIKEADESAARVRAELDKLSEECREFKKYLEKLEKKPVGGRKAVLERVLAGLKARHEKYDERIAKVRIDLRALSK